MPADGTEFVSLAQLKDYDDNRVTSGLDAKLNAPASDGSNGQMLVYGSSGNQWTDVPESTAYSADNATLQLTGTQFSVKDSGITAAKIANGTITAAKLASGVIPDVSEFITAADADEAYAAKSHTHANATASADGFMSSEDKTKLDGLQGQIDETKRLKPVNEIIAGTDLDTLTEPGSWFCVDSTSVANVPRGVAAEFLLYVYSGGGVVAHELHTPFGTWWRWKREDASQWEASWVRVLAPDGPLPLESGGTGADNAADARTALGLGNIYSMAPYVRSKSSSARLAIGTVVVNLVQSWCTLLNDASIRSLIGRSFDQGRDCIVVMNGDKNVQQDTVMTPVYNASTKEINLRVVQVIPSTAVTAVSGPMRINYILASG